MEGTPLPVVSDAHNCVSFVRPLAAILMSVGTVPRTDQQGADMTDRIETIRKLLEGSPDDVFLQYSLAMELASAGRHVEAVGAFRRCIEIDQNYLAAYVEAGKSLRSAGQIDAAREIFAEGMELAAMQGETHMRDHIQQQLDGLGAPGA